MKKKVSKPPSSNNQRKVFGKPLQKLYTNLLKSRLAPQSAEVVSYLEKNLIKEGLHYHPRTLKRQLSGKIRYIPEALEHTLLNWLQSEIKKPLLKSKNITEQKKLKTHYKKLIKDFEIDQAEIKNSNDEDLYISPEFFLKMARAYTLLKKQTSQRQLAVLIQKKLKQKNLTLGLETIQSVFAGKTKKIRKNLQEALLELFVKEGFASQTEVEKYLDQLDTKQILPNAVVKVGNLPQKIEAYRIRLKLRSKRQLALHIQNQLRAQGYQFHLSSLQSVLEGKTKRTKHIVLETIQNLLKTHEATASYPTKLTETEKQQHGYVDAKGIPSLVEQVLSKYPFITRRQLALLLRQELKEENFSFSLNSLQFILAGKTKRTRGILLDRLHFYLKDNHFQNIWEQRKDNIVNKKGRPSLESRLLEAYSLFQQSSTEESSRRKSQFLAIREEFIQKRWEKKFRKHYIRHRSSRKFQEGSWKGPEAWGSDVKESDTSWDSPLGENPQQLWERLVS